MIQQLASGSSKTIEEMVMLLKNGDFVYFEPLFYRFQPLVRNLNERYNVKSMELDDMYQEARIILLVAIDQYNEESPLRFAGYYKMLLQHRVYSLIRKQATLKRQSDHSAVSYEMMLEKNKFGEIQHENLMSSQSSPEQIFHVRESVVDYLNKLSHLERQVFTKVHERKDFEVIAVETDTDFRKVQLAYDRCYAKMKKMVRQ